MSRSENDDVNSTRSIKVIWIQLFFAFSIIAFATWAAVYQVEKRIQHELEDSLEIVLDTTRNSISLWVSNHIRSAQRLARSPELVEHAYKLLELEKNNQPIVGSEALDDIRTEFNPYLQTNRYDGFFVISPDNINIASSRNENIGVNNLLLYEQPDILFRLWDGKAIMGHPIPSDISISTIDGGVIARPPTMFVGSPIRNDEGKVIALLTLRLDPFRRFFPIVKMGRLGETGESYSFDSSGMLLTESKYDDELKKLGLIAENEYSSLSIQVRDPGVNLMKGEKMTSAINNRPLTQMAREAVLGENGTNLSGYRNYRGVMVVGAWLWDETLNMGLVIEQDYDEAYGTLKIVNGVIIGGAILAAIILFALVWISERGKKNLQSAETRLAAIFNASTDGIVVMRSDNRIEKINPAVLSIFGYEENDVIGHQFNMLIPADDERNAGLYFFENHNVKLSYDSDCCKQVQGIKREGKRFPLEISVNELFLQGEPYYACALRDITDRVEAEKKLEESNAELAMMAKVVQKTDSAVIITDQHRNIIWVNNGFTRISEYSLGDVLGRKPWECLHGEETDTSVAETMKKSLKKEDSAGAEIINYTKSGRAYWVKLETAPIFNDEGKIIQYITVQHDITDHKRLMKELQAANDEAVNTASHLASNEMKLLLALSGAGAGSWFVDLRSNDMHWDRRSLEIFGVDEESYTGDFREWGKYIHPDDLPTATKALLSAIENVKITNFKVDYRVILPDDSIKYVYATANIERDFSGEANSIFGLYFDITKQKNSEDALQNAKEEAESANRAKSNFLATMSHEIRTPMNGVVGMIDVLRATSLTEEQTDLLVTIKDSSFSLLSIIDDILDFSKIEAGKLALENVPVNIEKLIEGIGDTLLPIARKKGVELFIYASPELPGQVLTDPVRLRQVLFNLTGNAIKFTGDTEGRKGRVIIKAGVNVVESNNAEVVIQVIDNGIGMSKEVQESLFQPFVQGESSTTRRFGGTGLGLTISRHLAEIMGGEITMQSTEGKGSTFTVNFSFAVEKVYPEDVYPDLSGVNVVLMECDDFINSMLSHYLVHAGADVVIQNDSQINLADQPAFNKGNENLVIMVDIRENYKRKMTLGDQLSPFVERYDPRFVVLSRGQRRQARHENENTLALDLDAVHRKQLLSVVAAAVNRVSLEIPAPVIDENISGNIVFESDDGNEYSILIAEDNETNQKVLLHQLNMLGLHADIAENGRLGFEKWKAGRYSLILTDCHMPEMDGYEFAEAVRAHEINGERIPIIAITADALKGTQERCLKSGMDGYLTKPIQLNLLSESLTNWLNVKAKGHQPGTSMAFGAVEEKIEADVSEDEPVPVDPEVLKEILGIDDPVMLADFFHEFVKTSDLTVSEISAAYNDRQSEEIGGLCHKLKSSARAVGANDLGESCYVLEKAGKASDWTVIDDEYVTLPEKYAAVKKWIDNNYG